MSVLKNLARLAVLVVVVALGLTQSLACNTTEGAGKDMERAGEKIQDAAN